MIKIAINLTLIFSLIVLIIIMSFPIPFIFKAIFGIAILSLMIILTKEKDLC